MRKMPIRGVWAHQTLYSRQARAVPRASRSRPNDSTPLARGRGGALPVPPRKGNANKWQCSDVGCEQSAGTVSGAPTRLTISDSRASRRAASIMIPTPPIVPQPQNNLQSNDRSPNSVYIVCARLADDEKPERGVRRFSLPALLMCLAAWLPAGGARSRPRPPSAAAVHLLIGGHRVHRLSSTHRAAFLPVRVTHRGALCLVRLRRLLGLTLPRRRTSAAGRRRGIGALGGGLALGARGCRLLLAALGRAARSAAARGASQRPLAAPPRRARPWRRRCTAPSP